MRKGNQNQTDSASEPTAIDEAQARLQVCRAKLGIAGAQAPRREAKGNAEPDEWRGVDEAIEQIGMLEHDRTNYRATLVPNGSQIVVAYQSVTRGRVAKGAIKWLALFEIVECQAKPDAVGRLILRSWNEAKRDSLSPKHTLSRDFATVCHCPLRGLPHSASPNVILGSFLRGVWVLATTHTVTEFMDAKTKKMVAREPWEHYSVISSIDGVAAGSPEEPRYLSRRRRRAARPHNADVEAKVTALIGGLSK